MQSLNPRMLVVGLVAALFLGLATRSIQPLWGQEQDPGEKQTKAADDQPTDRAGRQRPRGRLPAYYTRVVSGEQREKIYEIQKGYQPKIQELLAQVQKLRETRDKEIDAILTPEQLERVKKLRAEARERNQRRQRQRRNQDRPSETESAE